MDADMVHEWLSLAILVLVLGISTVELGILLREASTPIIKDYEDKTALNATGSIMSDFEGQTGVDILMSLANADLNVPYPRSIRINNTPIIDINDAFLADVSSNLAAIYSPSGQYKLGSMLDYKVDKVEFVSDNVNGDYWQYTLVAP